MPKKAIPGLPPLRGSREKSPSCGAAELARSAAQPRAQTILAQEHRMMMIFLGGAQGKVGQQQRNFKTTSRAHRAHKKQKQEKHVGNCPHSTFIYEAAFEFRFYIPSSATE